MIRKPLLALSALAVLLAGPASAASLSPPNLVQATTAVPADLFLVWPTASTGPLEAMSYANLKALLNTDLSFLRSASNLSDLGSVTTARTNLGLGTAALMNTGTGGATVCVANAACTASAERLFAASTTGAASINIPQGVAPTSPANGDVWTTSLGVFAQAGGATQQLAAVSTTAWTPVVTFVVPGNLAVSYSTQIAQTIKVGTVCIASFRIATSALTFTTASGNFNITGLSPAPTSTYASASSGKTPGWSGVTGLTAVPTNIVSSGGVISLLNANGSPLTTANFTTGNNTSLSGNLTYPC